MTSQGIKAVLAVALTAGLAAGLTGCGKDDDGMGPAQKAGAAIDNVGKETVEKVEGSLQKAEQKAAELREKAEAAGEEVKERAEDAARDADRGLDKVTENVGRSVEQAGEKIQEKAAQ